MYIELTGLQPVRTYSNMISTRVWSPRYSLLLTLKDAGFNYE